MRKSKPLDALLPRTRQAILAATLPRPDRWWYLSDLAKHLGLRPSSLQRDLAGLVEAGVLRKRRDGNRVYFQPDPDCPIMPDLASLIAKTIGLVDVLRDALSSLADRIRCAFVYGSLARGDEQSASDVDLMVIGDVGLADLAPALARARERIGRIVNPTVYSLAEFTTRLNAGYGFHRNVLDGQKLFIVGSEHDLAATPGRRARRGNAGKQTGTRRHARRRRPLPEGLQPST